MAARHGLRARRALGFEALPRLAQRSAPALGGGELPRQLVATRLAVDLVLGRVDRLGLLQDRMRVAGPSDERAVARDDPARLDHELAYRPCHDRLGGRLGVHHDGVRGRALD